MLYIAQIVVQTLLAQKKDNKIRKGVNTRKANIRKNCIYKFRNRKSRSESQ